MTRFPYTYTILRYIHDIATEEFVNIGILLVSPEGRFTGFRLRRKPNRLTQMFSDFDRKHYATVINHLERQLVKRANNARGLPFPERRASAQAVGVSVIKEDDSAFQWSSMGSGTSADLQATLDQTYERLVEHHEEAQPTTSRSDKAVWRSFRDSLKAAGHLPVLQPKTVSTRDDEIEFQHTWKNGVWHCFEPLSFDLQKPRLIQQKAHTWLGGLTSVCEAAEDLRVYFLVGQPRSASLALSYERALAILRKVPVDHCIFSEEDKAQFVASVADVFRRERQAGESE